MQKMMKRVVAGVVTLGMLCSLSIMSTKLTVEASGDRPSVETSKLTDEMDSIREIIYRPQGENLQTGYSKIRILPNGELYAGGTTIADHTCKSVQITATLERAKWEDEDWEFVAMWQKENTNADLVSISKRVKVEKGWYYRVLCVHSADGDISSSATDGLLVE